ncbi:MAG: glycoside hydrolase family 127 protein, partial [Nitrososphaeria archaeon]
TQYKMLEETDRVNRFRWASGKILKRPEKSIFPFDDSDVYKWIEACAYTLAQATNEELKSMVNNVVSEIITAQESDGYIFTEFHGQKSLRWTNLTFAHELYCAGHLIQAAIALHRATGEKALLNAAIKFANLIVETFNPNNLKGVPGHPEIEMALVELYRETRNEKYLRTALFFLNERGKELLKPSEKNIMSLYNLLGSAEYFIDHKPFQELNEITGHAVRALYLNCGAADIYLETGEKKIYDTLIRLWNNMVNYKMYITGGVGSRYISEAFGENYELPNERAYAETCAAIANMMWNWRMLLITGDARFADIIELTLYNAILSGISLDGTKYFYINPLMSRGKTQRQYWFPVACCPTNIVRLLASLPGYFYSTSKKGIWIHLYSTGKARVEYNGRTIEISQKTNYPWDGKIEITINPSENFEFSIFLRIPGWSDVATIFIKGKKIKAKPSTYVEIRREWDSGDKIKLLLPMKVKLMTAHPCVTNNFNKVALKYGPIVYCLEQVDNPDIAVWNIMLIPDAKFIARYQSNLLGGVVTIKGKALAINEKEWSRHLYVPLDKLSFKVKKVRITAIPYYAWANRAPAPMTVWVPFINSMLMKNEV